VQEHKGTILISEKQLSALAEHTAPKSVSVWMPTHPAGAEAQQDPIRMKNLLTRAEEQLTALGVRASDARDRLSPLHAMARDGDFWRHQSRSLGVLLADDEPVTVQLPVEAPEVVSVCGHFHLKPLFGPVRRDGRFYLLQISQKTVRMLRAARFEIGPVSLPGAPKDFAEFSRFNDPERHLEFHTGTSAHHPGVSRPAVFHGQGSAADQTAEKKQLTEYCRRIDEAVVKVVRRARAPVLLAATEPLEGIYRRVSNCPQLDRRVIAGNADETEVRQLHGRGVAVFQEDWQHPIQAAIERYEQAGHLGLACNDLDEVLQAASANAVETLLVSLERPCWGRTEAEAGPVQRHDRQQPGDEDLLNLAAVLAHRGGATVHAIKQERLPTDSPVAAILRG